VGCLSLARVARADPTTPVPPETGAPVPAAPGPTGPGTYGPAPIYYTPPPRDPRVVALDRRIADVTEERRQVGLGGPIVMLSVGGGVFAVSGMLFLVYSEASCTSRYTDTQFCENRDTERTTFGIIALAGGALAVVGAVNLASAIGERRELGREIKRLRRERDEIEPPVSYDVELGPHLARARLRVAF